MSAVNQTPAPPTRPALHEIEASDGWVLSMLVRLTAIDEKKVREGLQQEIELLLRKLSDKAKPIGLALAGKVQDIPPEIQETVDALRTWLRVVNRTRNAAK